MSRYIPLSHQEKLKKKKAKKGHTHTYNILVQLRQLLTPFGTGEDSVISAPATLGTGEDS